MKNFILINLSTTGFYPDRGSKILKISYLKVDENLNIVKIFNEDVKIENLNKRNIQKFNLDVEYLNNCRSIEDILLSIKEDIFNDNNYLTSFNLQFVKKFLNYEYAKLGIDMLFNQFELKKSLKATYNVSLRNSLDNILNDFNIDLYEEKGHCINKLYSTLDLLKKIKLQDKFFIKNDNYIDEDIKIEIKSIKSWNFKKGSKTYNRKYVNMFYNDEFVSVFYDINKSKWFLKDFDIEKRNLNFSKIEQEVFKVLGVSTKNDFINYKTS